MKIPFIRCASKGLYSLEPSRSDLIQKGKAMTNRERAMNILHYRPVDRFPAVHFGYWSSLLEEWAEQGKIPKELADRKSVV